MPKLTPLPQIDEVKFVDPDAWPRGQARTAEEIAADRDDALDAPDEVTFGDGNVEGRENSAWIDEVVDPLKTGTVKRAPKPRHKQLPLPVARTYAEHHARWRDCQQCDLGQQRSQIVLARGDIPCDVLFVAEAPGISEDANGAPLVGPAGTLLDWVDARALAEWPHLKRAFCNLVGCFPRLAKGSGINEPDGVEIEACAERLREFVSLARPRLVILVGALAQRWWPKVVPEHFWRCRTSKLLHPGALLKPNVTEMQKQFATQRMVADLARAVDAIVNGAAAAAGAVQ